MCFTPEISLVTLITGITGSYLLFNLGPIRYKIIGGYLGYVSLMQLSELLLWKHQTCDDYHKKLSVMGMLLNSSQPIVLGLLILLFNPVNYYIIASVIAVYSAIIIGLYIPSYTSDLQCTQPREGDPHLVWNWNILPNYKAWWVLYIVTSDILIVYGIPKGMTFALAMTGSMLISTIVYPRQHMGAMWCFFTSLCPMTAYLYHIYH
jgi:hypothetical protein